MRWAQPGRGSRYRPPVPRRGCHAHPGAAAERGGADRMNAPALRPFKAKPPFDAPVSPSQDAYLQALAAQGYLAIVCRGNIDAVEAIRAYLLLPATVAA
ncbi:hypothetical protein ACYST8_05715 [Pseudomonas inefficax]